MADYPVGQIVVADEGLHHQIADTFAVVGPSDPAWTEDCSTAANARRLHQIRDTVIRVTDPVGGGVGLGNCQPIITGGHAEHGLTDRDTSW